MGREPIAMTGGVGGCTADASRIARGRADQAPLIVWCDGAYDPAENMRRDVALLDQAERAAASGYPHSPVLRLFRFAPHGITLGSSQDPARVLDLEALEADGIPWAVRPTGGRAIFHAEEWTYSMVAPIDDPCWGGTLGQACDRISLLIAASLQRLGVPVSVTRTTSALKTASLAPPGEGALGGGTNPACFASTTRHEIVIEGRKLAGSAQRRTAHVLLQQGSILLGRGHLRLVDYVLASGERRESLRLGLARASCHAGRYLRRASRLAEWADAIMEELPPGARRVSEAGHRLLTLSEAPFYTANPLYRGNTAL